MDRVDKRRLMGWILVVFVLHMIVAVQLRTVTMWEDEVMQQAIAAFFAGEDWSTMVHAYSDSYYGYAASLLYVPIYWLVKDPDIRYLCMGALNAALVSCAVVLIYHVLDALHTLTPKKCRLYAVLVAISPSFTVYTKWMWGEPLLAVFPWVLLLVVIRLVQGRGNLWLQSALIGFLLVFAYCVNGRGLIYAVCIAMLLVYVRLACKKWFANLPALLLSTGVFSLVHAAINRYVVSSVWHIDDPGTMKNTMPYILAGFQAGASGNAEEVPLPTEPVLPASTFLRTLLSHVATSSIASFGLVLLVFVFLGLYIWKKAKAQNILLASVGEENILTWETVGLFSLLTFLGGFAVTILSFAHTQGDYLIYTRYYSPGLGMVTLLAVLIVNEIGFSKKQFLLTGALFALCPLLYLAAWQSLDFGRVSVYFHIYPFLFGGKSVAFFCAGAITLGIFIAFALLSRRKGNLWNCALLAAAFLYVYAFCAGRYIIPSGRSETAQWNGIKTVMREPMLALPDTKFYTVDLDGQCGKLQFRLPQTPLTPLEGVEPEQIKENIAQNSVILAASDLELDLLCSDMYRVEDSRLRPHENLWIYGEQLANTLKTQFGFDLVNRLKDPVRIAHPELKDTVDLNSLEDERVLCEEDDFTLETNETDNVMIAKFPIQIKADTVYRIDLELSEEVNEQARGMLAVDLAAEGYDNAQQEVNGFVTNNLNDYQIYLDSGTIPQEPLDVAVRILCYGVVDDPVDILHFTVTELTAPAA